MEASSKASSWSSWHRGRRINTRAVDFAHNRLLTTGTLPSVSELADEVGCSNTEAQEALAIAASSS